MATKRTRVPVYTTFTGDAAKFEEDIPLAPETFTHSGHLNRRLPSEYVGDAFENHFAAKVAQGPLEPDEVSIYRYGILIRPRMGEATPSVISGIQEILSEYPGSSIHVIDEDATFSIRINLGSPVNGSANDEVAEDLRRNQTILDEIYSLLEAEYGATEWLIFWDTEEPGWESG